MENNKIKIKICESRSIWLVRDSIELDLNDYPELQEKSENEMRQYILENWDSMKSPNNESFNLFESLIEQDIVREKDTDSEYHLYFE